MVMEAVGAAVFAGSGEVLLPQPAKPSALAKKTRDNNKHEIFFILISSFILAEILQ